MEERQERITDQFYAAVLDQDERRIQDMCEKHGSNCPIEEQGGAAGGLFWKHFSTFPLHVAASHMKVQSMRSLLVGGANAHLRDQRGRSPLHLLLSSWPLVSAAAAPKNNHKLHNAVVDKCRQAEECLLLLCRHGVDVNQEMVEGNARQTALHVSVRRRTLAAVRILASGGADVHAVDSNGMTPLHVATWIRHRDIMKSLISHGAEVNQTTQTSGNTPLHIAAVTMTINPPEHPEDRLSMVSILFQNRADPNVLNRAGLSPLQAACSVAAEETVDLLLQHGADLNQQSRAGESCLFLFLNHEPNVKKNSLLVKLLGLTSPLSLYNRHGELPAAMTARRFSQQRERLLRLAGHPKRLKDVCKTVIYLEYVQGKQNKLKQLLPAKLYDFVFNHWENIHNIYFDTDKQEV